MVRLSVLDQSPVPSGSTPADALRETVALAQATETLGYSRYWLAEHHGTPGLAGSAPEVLVGAVASATTSMRVGAGGVLLAHYSPLKVAETFRVLAALFPGRIDLGIGRADGAGPPAAAALRAGVGGAAPAFGQKLADLLACLDGTSAELRATPDGVDRPDVWLLASSSDGAEAAAVHGLPLCFAHFISTGFGPQNVSRYRSSFRPGATGAPEASVAVAVICADTDDEAEQLAISLEVWRLDVEDGRGPLPSVAEAKARPQSQLDAANIRQKRKSLVVGSPERVHETLSGMMRDFGTDEVVIVTNIHDPAARLRSYQLVAEAFGLTPGA